ncbi:hypothetical protein OIU91_19935 [Streptomyces sp. NBC_01456]|uniref:hypothetical protein n=1 Tax=Streptomyces sp. NBC_01456 TaxID=2975868 RepID=UPI002E30D200|nr:hypothetical protein [Streptomyces sp. NBC_01456]
MRDLTVRLLGRLALALIPGPNPRTTLLKWAERLFPARGKHRAAPAPAPESAPDPSRGTNQPDQPNPEPANASVDPWRTPWRGPSAKAVRAIFHAEEVQSLTQDQRERWWAAAFLEIGVEYDFPTVDITPARQVVAA